MKYKKYIFDKLTDTTILEIIDALTYISPKSKTSFLKEYSLTDKDRKLEELTKNEIYSNYKTLKKIYKIICEKRQGLFHYMHTKKYKTYILDKIPESNINDIVESISFLKSHVKTRFLKEYSLINRKEPLEKITAIDSKNNQRTLRSIRNDIKNGRKENYPNLFKLLKNYKREDILLAVECLTKEEKDLLYKKYGKDLTNTYKIDNLTNEEIKKIRYSITRKLKRILERLQIGEYKVIGIYDVLPYNKKEQKALISELSKAIKKKIYENFGSDLERKTLINIKDSFFTPIEEEIIKKIYNNTKLKHKKFKTFISQFESVRNENETDNHLLLRIKRNLLKIKRKHQELVYRKYDYDLLNIENKFNFTKEENKEILRLAIPAIKGFIKREEENLKTKKGILIEIKKFINTDEYKILESLYGNEYALSIMNILYFSDINLEGIVELNKEEELLVLLLSKDYLKRKKEFLYKETIDIKEFTMKK